MLNRPLAISVLNPTSLFPDDINQNSIVLKVTYGSISFLFMGDANAETRIASSGTNLLADILKVGHLTAPWSSNVNTSHTIPASFCQIPVAIFTANRTSGCLPTTVQFTDSPAYDPTIWNWSFGAGTTSTERTRSRRTTLRGSTTFLSLW